MQFHSTDVPVSKAILIQVELFQHTAPDLAELKELAVTAGFEIVAHLEVKRSNLDPELYIGKGKVAELEHLAQHHEANLIIFNHDLSPSQERNLEKSIHIHVMSRTALILEIFAQRAKTHEGKLQVELARLQYQATRLVKGWSHLERQRGGIGVRGGPGETQLEIDKRLIRQRIKRISQDLTKVKKQRHLGRTLRKKTPVPVVALVGYTNAGKSTLFNRLTGAEVYVANQLFATLDPTLRRVNLPGFGEIIFADTVGFIRDLPHSLVDAFRATLEETVEADLLLHVIDAFHEEYSLQKEQVLTVLKEIGAEKQAMLEVMNKVDLLEAPEIRVDSDNQGKPTRVWVSALTGVGLSLLQDAILQHLSESVFEGELVLGPEFGELRATLYAWKAIQKEEIDAEGRFHLQLHISKSGLAELLKAHDLV